MEADHVTVWVSAGLPYITTEISVYLPRSSQAGTM